MTPVADITFPEGFAWGAATSAYQVEGAVDEEGRGQSIWDTWCQVPGAIRGGDTGAVAADHYHRVGEDVALMRSLGLRAYRFSIAWPRIQPTGTGPANQVGLDFYRRLSDELLDAGIEPVATLYHWDLPQALEDVGGWPARETAGRFADYAALVFEALHDRIPRWSTHNEPWCTAMLGYADAVFAPGRHDAALAARAIHHLLLSHGLAVEAMRAIDPVPAQGVVLNLQPIRPTHGRERELEDALRRWDGLRNRVWTEPLLRGRYPADVLSDLEAFGGLPVIEGDLATIAQPLDWVGINYYNDEILDFVPGRAVASVPGAVDAAPIDAGPDATDMGWPITPDGLRDLLVTLKVTYPDVPPIYVTENGAAYEDPIEPDGAIHDERRIAYLDAHLRALAAAIEAGVDVRGYFAWSLLDNFEWAHGYAMRFGIVHVDYDTLARTPRDSAYWYRDLIARNGLVAPSR